MRVLVAADAIDGLSARESSESIARAFLRVGAEVAVVVLEPQATRPPLRQLLESLESVSLVDLRGVEADDFGVSLLGEQGLPTQCGDVIVDVGTQHLRLTGIDGWAVTKSRETGEDLAAGLAADAAAARWLKRLGIEDAPGAGAAGGLGALVLAAGGRVFDAIQYVMEQTSFTVTARQADLIVTGCTDLDFHVKGGELVQRVVEVAEQALTPVISFSGRNFVSSRELRQAGIEEAHAVYEGADQRPVTEEELSRLAERVARSWMIGATH